MSAKGGRRPNSGRLHELFGVMDKDSRAALVRPVAI